ncbi:MAG: 5'/3'-nucleotidase SurE [Pseudomonadota bacterium]
MRILISNDDGYMAPGLHILADALRQIAEVIVVAPDRDYSGASHSLSLAYPIRTRHLDNGIIRVEGTPTDCVHLALTGMITDKIDMVVSGINAGANMGDDVLYSGTVAAATEGRYLGLPAIAISMATHNPQHNATAAHIAHKLVCKLQQHNPFNKTTILNVNVPDIPVAELKGLRSTRLGHRHKAEPAIRTTDPRGRPLYWIGAAGAAADNGEDTDFAAVADHCVSITPLQVDLTQYAARQTVADWLHNPA